MILSATALPARGFTVAAQASGLLRNDSGLWVPAHGIDGSSASLSGTWTVNTGCYGSSYDPTQPTCFTFPVTITQSGNQVMAMFAQSTYCESTNGIVVTQNPTGVNHTLGTVDFTGTLSQGVITGDHKDCQFGFGAWDDGSITLTVSADGSTLSGTWQAVDLEAPPVAVVYTRQSTP